MTEKLHGEPPTLDSEQVRRREFLTKGLATAGGASAFLAGLPGTAASFSRSEVASVLESGNGDPELNPLDRMIYDLEVALAKPMDQRKWIMVIDLQRCTGCKACTVSCQSENNLPPGVIYRPVIEQEIGEFPHVRVRFTPRPCMHCENPPCTPVCPVGATYKRPDGIVAVDYDVCIGCRYCLSACPYNARTADFGEFFGEGMGESESLVGAAAMGYEERPNFEYGHEWSRKLGKNTSPMGNARKCQFCLHRLENKMLPACVTTCLGGATFFGDFNLKTSLVRELVGDSRMTRLREELGTEPKVFYLM
jgi:Fe-S-cluster-containing dehydrogenase component